MKEKISQLAKERFLFETPEVCFSEKAITLTVKKQGKVEANVIVSNTMKRSMKGVVYSSDERLLMEHTTFVGEEAELKMRYDASTDPLDWKEKTATITVVSNYGVASLPVRLVVEETYLEIESKQVTDLEQFAKVVKEHPAEAAIVFRTPEFRELFVEGTKKRRQYDSLVSAPVVAQAMEEFLVATHHKKRVVLSLSETKKRYLDLAESVTDEIVILSNEWGYVEATIEADCDWIVFEQDTITSEQLANQSCNVPYTIVYERLQKRKETATITVKTATQEVCCEVLVEKQEESEVRVRDTKRFQLRKQQAALVDTYLEFRLNHVTKEEYEEQLQERIDQLLELGAEREGKLWLAHLYLITGKREPLEQLMDQFAIESHDMLEESLEYYMAFRYLEVLYSNELEVMEGTVKLFRSYLQTEREDWRLLWYLLYIDTDLEDDHAKRVEAVKAMIESGVYSPVLYFEMAFSYNKEPKLLEELGRVERLVMHWAIKHRFISEELAKQFVLLSMKVRKHDKLLLQDLMVVYEYRASEECLSSILRMLITGQMADNAYFKWYERGVKNNIKITELYEYYMYSINERDDVAIEDAALQYFVYNDHLPEAKKAFLYAYILRNKEMIQSVFRLYEPQMESFTKKMVLKGASSPSMLALYEAYLRPEKIELEMAKALPQILFRYEVRLDNPNITQVIVHQPELKEERIFTVDKGVCMLTMATKDAQLVFLDAKKNRYLDPGSYTIRRLFYHPELIKRCYERYNQHVILLLDRRKMLATAMPGSKDSDEWFEVMNNLIECGEISEEFRSVHEVFLMEQAYKQGDMVRFERYLMKIAPEHVRRENHKLVTEALIRHHDTHQAVKMVELYGYEPLGVEAVEALVLLLLDSHAAVNRSEKTNHLLVSMCDYLYRNGRRQPRVLAYLCEHYENITSKMLEREKAFAAAGIDTIELQERILGQMLFSEDGLEESRELFASYYNKEENNKMLVRGYLNYMAYRFVRFDEPITRELCDWMKRESFYYESKVSMLAMLKFYKDIKELTEEELKLLDYNLHKFIGKGTVLPFFKEYAGRISLPEAVTNRTYVEYRGMPDCEVMMQYRLSPNAPIDQVPMREVFSGIYVKDFVLFYGETLEYWFPEEKEPRTVTMQTVEHHGGDRFEQINQMLEAFEKGNAEQLQEQLSQYAIEDYITSSLFTPL